MNLCTCCDYLPKLSTPQCKACVSTSTHTNAQAPAPAHANAQAKAKAPDAPTLYYESA